MSTWILDPGHEGTAFGLYLRKGKQSPSVPPGIYEGEFNRAICERVQSLCEGSDIPSIVTAPGPINVPLKDRVAFANKLHKARGDCVLISIHANAAPGAGWSDANGFTVFHATKPSDESKRLARLIHSRFEECVDEESRGIRSANFAVLGVRCPAVLVECGFMTNESEAEYLASENGRDDIAYAIWPAICDYEDGIK